MWPRDNVWRHDEWSRRHVALQRRPWLVSGVFGRFKTPSLTLQRVRLAYVVAIATDVLQFALGPLGWAGADELLDVATAAAMWRLLGFHPLLLPTFLVEFLPITDMLPTWTACVALVVAARKARQDDIPPPPGPGPVIDI